MEGGPLTGMDSSFPFWTWLNCVLEERDPSTVPILLISIGAMLACTWNGHQQYREIRRLKGAMAAEVPENDRLTQEAARERIAEETKRKIGLDTVIAGFALLAYLLVLMVNESLGSLAGKVVLILAALPGTIGFCHHVFAVGRHFTRRQTTVESYVEFRKRYDRARRGGNEPSPFDELANDDIADYTPPLPQTFFAALILTAIFLVPASMTRHPYFLWPADQSPPPILASPQTDRCALGALPRTQQAPPPRPITINTTIVYEPQREADKVDPRLVRDKQKVALVNGTFYAGLGAYVWMLYLLISRINTATLTSRFLLNCGVRAAMGIGIGAIIALAGTAMFKTEGIVAPILLFLIGLLPQWALTSLRNKAKEWFAVREDGCETLPVCLVDGLNDGLIDLLSEHGVGDIEHLANADAGELTLQTLFPLARVADWIDQAILIQQVRGDIVHCRKAGIAKATDYARLYGELIGDVLPPLPRPATAKAAAAAPAANAGASSAGTDVRADAKKIFTTLATASSRTEEALYNIGRKLYQHYVVRLLWNLADLPGSIWCGWVTQVAEWMPTVFAAAQKSAKAAGTWFDPPPAWGNPFSIQDRTKLADFDAKFRAQLQQDLPEAGYAIDDAWAWPASPNSWREVIAALFPRVERRF